MKGVEGATFIVMRQAGQMWSSFVARACACACACVRVRVSPRHAADWIAS